MDSGHNASASLDIDGSAPTGATSGNLTLIGPGELTFLAADLPTGLTPLDYPAIVGHLELTFGIAVWFGRKQSSTEDFFVGGRRMPFIAVGLSILATLFSTISNL